MKKTLLAVLLPTIFLFSACGTAVEEDGTVTNSDVKIYGTIKKVDIEGTTCIVYDADNGGGALSCDWNDTPTTESEFDDGLG